MPDHEYPISSPLSKGELKISHENFNFNGCKNGSILHRLLCYVEVITVMALPVCVLRCLASSSDLVNLLPQPTQVH